MDDIKLYNYRVTNILKNAGVKLKKQYTDETFTPGSFSKLKMIAGQECSPENNEPNICHIAPKNHYHYYYYYRVIDYTY